MCFRCSGRAKLAAASVNIVSKFWSHQLGIWLYICQSMNAIAASWWCFTRNQGITGMIRSCLFPVIHKMLTSKVHNHRHLWCYASISRWMLVKRRSRSPMPREATNHLYLWRGNYFYRFTLTLSSHQSVTYLSHLADVQECALIHKRAALDRKFQWGGKPSTLIVWDLWKNLLENLYWSCECVLWWSIK